MMTVNRIGTIASDLTFTVLHRDVYGAVEWSDNRQIARCTCGVSNAFGRSGGGSDWVAYHETCPITVDLADMMTAPDGLGLASGRRWFGRPGVASKMLEQMPFRDVMASCDDLADLLAWCERKLIEDSNGPDTAWLAVVARWASEAYGLASHCGAIM